MSIGILRLSEPIRVAWIGFFGSAMGFFGSITAALFVVYAGLLPALRPQEHIQLVVPGLAVVTGSAASDSPGAKPQVFADNVRGRLLRSAGFPFRKRDSTREARVLGAAQLSLYKSVTALL